jgi:long-chain fatty acid transport protein
MVGVRNARRIVAWALLFAAALVPGGAHAGGILLYEVGTPDIGYASAGYASRADGPVTLLTNPAGMTRLDGIQVQVGTEALFGALTFAPDANTTVSGNNGGNAVGFFPNGSVFATFAPWKDVRLGMGVASNFGLSEKWDSGWVGRYYTTQSTLIGLSLLPSVAWHIAGGFSVGATVNVMYGYLKQTVAIQNLEPQAGDGALAVQSGAWGVGGNVGLLYEFSDSSRLGVTYTSPVRLGFSSTPQFSGLGPGLTAALHSSGLDSASINLGMTVPQTVMLSFFQRLSDKWAAMADAGWQNWAAFGTVDVQVTAANPHSLTTNIGYTNTWHGALGGQVQLSEPWQLDFGIAYDSTMTTASNRSLSLAVGDAWRFGLGARWAVDSNWTLGLAYEFLWGGSPSVDVNRGPLAGTVSGSYANTSIQFLTFNFTWKS